MEPQTSQIGSPGLRHPRDGRPAPVSAQTPQGLPQQAPSPGAARDRYEELKANIHHHLFEREDLFRVLRVDPDAARSQVRADIEALLEALLIEARTSLDSETQQRLIKEIENDIFGLGPLEPLMNDPTVNDILVNKASQVYVERHGKLELTGVTFRSDDHLLHIIDRIVSRVGRRVDEACPMVDARLPDGSRVNAAIPPIALDGPILSIRKFREEPLTIDDLIQFTTIPRLMKPLLDRIVKARLNVLISGGTGSGKTTLLNALSAFIPPTERIATIEDAAELRLQQPHVVRLEVRPPNIEGRGEVTCRDLVRNVLRMRPDRIIVGEVRGGEALDMLQAMNTGHEGSITTIHANSPREALNRLETMILLAGTNLTQRAMRQQISAALDVVIQVQRFSDGVRRLVLLSEIVGMEGDVVTMQDLCVFRQTGVGPDGGVLGGFTFTGVRPSFADRLAQMGLGIDWADLLCEAEEQEQP